MDQEPLVAIQIDAGQRLLTEFEKYAPVKSAVWLREPDGGRWYLNIVSTAVSPGSTRDAYGEVLKIVGGMKEPKLDPFRVRVIASEDPAAGWIEELSRHTGTTPPPWRELGVTAEDAYFYALPSTVSKS
jgi:hypothetical protein